MIARTLKTLVLCLLAAVIFPVSWLKEQPFALKMAYWNTFGPAFIYIKKSWGKK